MKSVGEMSQECSQIVLKCLYLVRIGPPDILWSVNKLARSITKWTKACDKRLSRLISCIHHTCEYKQYCYVGNTAKQCRLGLFQDSDFAGDLEDSKSTSTSVSHSSTESEIISLDAGLRLDWIPALDLWDLIVSVLGNKIQTLERPVRSVVRVKDQRSQGITNVLNIKYFYTKNQLADILTKGNFTHDEWNHLLCLFNISHFQFYRLF